MFRQASILAGLAAVAASALPLAASAVPMVPVPQPPGVSCTSVKIAGPIWGTTIWANMNCANGRAYAIKNKTILIPLLLPAGATSEWVNDIDDTGRSVGAVLTTSGTVDPYMWKPNGVPMLLPPNAAAEARGIQHGHMYIVGDLLKDGVAPQALWLHTGAPHLVGPTATSGSLLNDVSFYKVYVGQYNGMAAVGMNPGNLGPIPGVTKLSVAYQIMDKNWLVGHEDYPSTVCGTGLQGTGFIFFYPSGPLNMFAPLPGDCTASAEDINDNYGVVGSSSPGVPGMQRAESYNVIGGGYTDLNALPGAPWVRLTDATGTDDNYHIIATDGGAAITQVYIVN
jgi:hypothetical protein